MAGREERALWAANPGMQQWIMAQGGTTGQTPQGQLAAFQNRQQPWPEEVYEPSSYGPAPEGYFYGNNGELRSNVTGQPTSNAMGQSAPSINWSGVSGWGAAYPENVNAGQEWGASGFPRFDPFAADTPHPGWNYGEAGPPGSPEFVRHPQNQADWEARYNWFVNESEGQIPGIHARELDPRWRPINTYYQQGDPNIIARLQGIASGTIDQWGWDPRMAQEQLKGWGLWTEPGAVSKATGGGGYPGRSSAEWGQEGRTPGGPPAEKDVYVTGPEAYENQTSAPGTPGAYRNPWTMGGPIPVSNSPSYPAYNPAPQRSLSPTYRFLPPVYSRYGRPARGLMAIPR